MCSAPELPNGDETRYEFVDGPNPPFTHGTNYTVACKEGLTAGLNMNSNATARCDDGVWSPIELRCYKNCLGTPLIYSGTEYKAGTVNDAPKPLVPVNDDEDDDPPAYVHGRFGCKMLALSVCMCVRWEHQAGLTST
jgi:hypothetical protein